MLRDASVRSFGSRSRALTSSSLSIRLSPVLRHRVQPEVSLLGWPRRLAADRQIAAEIVPPGKINPRHRDDVVVFEPMLDYVVAKIHAGRFK